MWLFKNIFKMTISRGRRNIWPLVFVLSSAIALIVLWIITANRLETIDQELHHFRRSRNLSDYIDDIQLLIEPSITPCKGAKEVPLVAMVTSVHGRMNRREVIRDTYAKHLPTYFLLGIDGNSVDESKHFVDLYLEAKEHGDMVIYEFHDHYQNLTLKTGLMMKWFLKRCPQAGFLLKTDDDVFINPWVMKEVAEEKADEPMIGHLVEDARLQRGIFSKWHIPYWLLEEDLVKGYLEGPGYLVNGAYVQRILEAAYHVPIINVEDIYFTYLIANKSLGLPLFHDSRFQTRQTWSSLSNCAYWSRALVHSVGPEDMMYRWCKIDELTRKLVNKEKC